MDVFAGVDAREAADALGEMHVGFGPVLHPPAASAAEAAPGARVVSVLHADEAKLGGRAILFFDGAGQENSEECSGEPSGHAPIV
jgi:hypothetical protein